MTTTSHRMKLGVNAIVYTALVGVTLVVLNVGGHYLSGRADLTEDGLYTLSPVSKNLVKSLPADLKIRVFVSKKLVAGLDEVRQYVIDKLKDYAEASNGRFKWEIVHPEESDSAKKLTEQYRIPKFDAQTARSGSKESREIYFGMSLSYKAPKAEKEEIEVLPVIGWNIQQNLEYLLTERIHRLVKGRKKILLVTGHDEAPAQQVEGLIKALNRFFQNYKVEQYNIRGGQPAPADAQVLLVIPPNTPWTDPDKQKLNAFLMQGKGVLFLLEGMAVQKQRQQFQMQQMPTIMMPAEHGLNDLLGKWGVKVQGNFVMDEGQQPLMIRQGNQAQVIFHPALLNIWVSRHLKAPITPMLASSLELTAAYVGQKIQPGKAFRVQPLLVSSEKAWTVTGPYVPNLQRRDRPPDNAKRGRYVVGALVEGKLPSAYPAQGPKESGSSSRMVVVGDFDILARLGTVAGNQVFLQNLVDWLAQDEALVKLRNKQMQERAMSMPESKGTRVLLQIALIIGLPLLLIAFGVIRWQIRVSRRQAASRALD